MSARLVPTEAYQLATTGQTVGHVQEGNFYWTTGVCWLAMRSCWGEALWGTGPLRRADSCATRRYSSANVRTFAPVFPSPGETARNKLLLSCESTAVFAPVALGIGSSAL